MINTLRNQKGMAITVVMVVLMVLALLAGYVLNLGYNRKRILDIASGTQARIYYRAQAGVHDAGVRIRKNYVVGLVPEAISVGTSFTDAGYNPAGYTIDVNGDGIMDTTIDIGASIGGAKTNCFAGVRRLNLKTEDV